MSATDRQRALARRALARYQDPVLFAYEALGLDLWEGQQRILRAVASHRRVAGRSGHKVGKSVAAAALALWWVCVKPRATVIMSSSSARQVKTILWRELKKIVRDYARVRLGGVLNDSPDTGYQFSDGRCVFGFSTNEPERMAGYSGDNLLYILDEASGMDQAIFEAIEGNRAGGASLLMLSNPTKTTGEFHAAFTSKRSFYGPDALLHLSSEDAAKVVGLPGLVRQWWIDEKLREWGRESLLFQVRAAGNFPKQSATSIIGVGLLEEARQRYDDRFEDGVMVDRPKGRLTLGVDPARQGDDASAVAPRRGKHVYPLSRFRKFDGVQLAGHVLNVLDEHLEPGDEPAIINVDVNGVGASCYDQLAYSTRRDFVVHPINSAEASSNPNLVNLRAQLHFGVRDFLRDGGELPPDGELEEECLAPEFFYDARNRIAVTKKDKLKEKLGRSPDAFDAVALACYETGSNAARVLEADPDDDDDYRRT